MNNIILFDDESRDHLLPLTYTRPACELRLGILTIREKWEKMLKGKSSFITQGYLAAKYPLTIEDRNYVVNGSAIPSDLLCRLVQQLENNEALLYNGQLIATLLNRSQFESLINEEEIEELNGFELEDTPFLKISQLPDIFRHNDAAIRQDFELLIRDRQSESLSESNRLIGPKDQLFIEKGATIEGATLNTNTGPIYIGQAAEVMEGALLRGPIALCQNAKIKMGAKIYGATTIGPFCKAGGEISNSVMTGYSNKGHEGYLGNSVLGEWCNLGADTNTSNLKNNYDHIKLWNYPEARFVGTGLQFCGLIMGDHSKCGINTMFNTGTVVGIFANIFGSGYPRNFIPSFAWGGTHGFNTYKLPKAMDTAKRVMQRRDQQLNEEDCQIFEHLFEATSHYRAWEKVVQP